MKLVTFERDLRPVLGVLEGAAVLDLEAAGLRYALRAPWTDMVSLIGHWGAWRGMADDALASARLEAGDPVLWRKLEATRLLAPIPRPNKNVFCVGRNYKAHIEEGARAMGREVRFPKVPEFFTKPPTAVAGHDAVFRWSPAVTEKLDYEVELAIVIGRRCRDLKPGEGRGVVFGYTIVNDISARDLQSAHSQFFKGKALDGSCPMGPCFVTADEFGDPSGHRLSLRVNGEVRQDSTTSDLLFGCDAIVESLSKGLTLEPGDVIATGTPAGVALGMDPPVWLKGGDVVEAEVEGIGLLRTRIVERA